MECKNCGHKLNENAQYCDRCGQKVIKEPLSLKQIFTDLLHIITNLERGLLFTIKEMAIRPYHLINEYIEGKTKPFYGPLRFLILTVTLSVVVNISLGLYDQQQETIAGFLLDDTDTEAMERQRQFSETPKKYANVIPLLIIPFVSLMSYAFFQKRKLNYAEHLVMNAYLSGFTSLLGILFQLSFWLLSIPIFTGLMASSLINYVYFSWTYKHLFDYSWAGALSRGALTLSLGFIIFSVFSGLIGFLVTLLVLSLTS